MLSAKHLMLALQPRDRLFNSLPVKSSLPADCSHTNIANGHWW